MQSKRKRNLDFWCKVGRILQSGKKLSLRFCVCQALFERSLKEVEKIDKSFKKLFQNICVLKI